MRRTVLQRTKRLSSSSSSSNNNSNKISNITTNLSLRRPYQNYKSFDFDQNNNQIRKFSNLSSCLKMRVIPVPVRTDNYAYLLVDEPSKLTAVIDPFDPKKVIEFSIRENLNLTPTIFTTHHHYDHAGGNEEFLKIYKENFPSSPANNHNEEKKNDESKLINDQEERVYGGSEKVSKVTKVIERDGTKIRFGDNVEITCLRTNCHTQDSLSYFVEDLKTFQKFVFTGDTLFIGGCGRFFEGNAKEMNEALNSKLASLPDETITCIGHEYTTSNVRFGRFIEPENQSLKDLESICLNNQPTTCKFTIGDEKKFNVFMRLDKVKERVLELTKDDEDFKGAYDGDGDISSVEVMRRLRRLKDQF